LKKIVRYTLSIALLGMSLTIQVVQTQAEPKEDKIYKTTYATTEDIFLDTIYPELNKFVQDKYGSSVHWADSKIVEIKCLVSPDKWTYQAKIMIKVFGVGEQQWSLDQITLNYDSLYRNHEVKDSLSKPKIELVEYKQMTRK